MAMIYPHPPPSAIPTPFPAEGYAGNMHPSLAWEWAQTRQAILVDVRTPAECAWVGEVPGSVAVPWKLWPGMVNNPDFDAQLCAAVPAGAKVMLLCRSGIRSVAAARRATELGREAYNILEGFEGESDGQAQRGKLGGWRFYGLPWHQS